MLEVLLILEVLVCSNQNIESVGFCAAQKLAVFERTPASLKCGFHLMRINMLAKRNWRSLIEQNPHSRHFQGAGGVFEDSSRLLKGNPRKPFQKLRQLGTVFEVLEQGRYRHARAAKYPRATDPVGIALHGSTGGPINHCSMLRQVGALFNVAANVCR